IQMGSLRADSRRPLLLPARIAGSRVRGLAAPATRRRLAKRKPSGLARGFPADFSGAIPVASALGAATGATLLRQIQLTMAGLDGQPKPELSTLPERGTFYFALTATKDQLTGSDPRGILAQNLLNAHQGGFAMRLVTCLLVCAVGLLAQGDRGTITGTVADPAGAMVANAAIEARNVDNGATYPVASTATGNYTITSLPTGNYELTV